MKIMLHMRGNGLTLDGSVSPLLLMMRESSGAAKTPKDKGNQKAKTSVIECKNRTVTQEAFENQLAT
jgi:hypothetical protein